MGMDYKKAGVDVEAGDALVDWLQTQKEPMPHQDKVVSGIGGFAALFKADFQGMKEPCIVAGTDGVGTKVKLASHFQDYRGVGQDLVAMCANDLICCGAQPLFFLDYYATGKLEPQAAQEFLTGVRRACIQSDMALIGGETAEMPGVYAKNDFDCAGFAVGVVDRAKMLGPHLVQEGDHLLAVASSGFHSNGFSLLRRVFEADVDQWKDELLRPTHLYAALMKSIQKLTGLRAAANITGGGMDNIPRVIPHGLCAELDPWTLPEIFQEVQRRTKLQHEKLLTTLNCGVGFVLVVQPEWTKEFLSAISQAGFRGWSLGRVVRGQGEAQWRLSSRGVN